MQRGPVKLKYSGATNYTKFTKFKVQTINKMPSIKAQIKPLLHQIKVPAFIRREARTEERSPPGLQASCRSRRKERKKERIQSYRSSLVRQPAVNDIKHAEPC